MTSVDFYSMKRGANVRIPANKVCGYRIKNDWMKDGYSDGVKAGRNNGVVDQRLSRFATQADREKAESNCAGDTNWLNYRGPKFCKVEDIKNQFIIRRPTFKEGTVIPPPDEGAKTDISTINQRSGRGNRIITRPAFMASAIKPRLGLGFEAYKMFAIGESAVLRDEQPGLTKTYTIRVPDPTDFKWLDEKKREEGRLTIAFTPAGGITSPAIKARVDALVAEELRRNPPLGRPQKTYTKQTNSIAGESITTEAKLKEVLEEIKQGRVEGKTNTQQIITDTANIISGETKTLEAESVETRRLITDIVGQLNIPKGFRAMLGPQQPQIVGGGWLEEKDNFGRVVLFLLSNVRDDPARLTLNEPLYNYGYKGYNPLKPIAATSLSEMRQKMVGEKGKARRYLDLYRRGLLTAAQVNTLTFARSAGSGASYDLRTNATTFNKKTGQPSSTPVNELGSVQAATPSKYVPPLAMPRPGVSNVV